MRKHDNIGLCAAVEVLIIIHALARLFKGMDAHDVRRNEATAYGGGTIPSWVQNLHPADVVY